jgi:hypothetical protein
VLLDIRLAPKEECGISAAEAVFGIPLTIFDGPYAVKAWADKYYDVMVGDKCERISIDRLKPYTGTEQPEVALPRKN